MAAIVVSRRWIFPLAALYLAYTISILISFCNADKSPKPPKFTKEPERETTFKDGQVVDLDCEATGDPAPTYTWKKDGKDLKMGLEIRQLPGKGTITIEEPRSVHEGEYQCFAANSYGIASSVKTMLKKAVLDPFPTVKDPKVHRPKVGSSLTLLCHPPLSYPAGVIFWGENKQTSKGSKLRPTENTERVSLDYKGTLYFSNIEMGDSLDGRTYVCIQQNMELRSLAQGDDQKIEPQAVTGTPHPEKPVLMWSSLGNQNVEVALRGQPKKMKCIFSGFPTPLVSWVRLDENLQEKAQISSYGQEIIIPDVDYRDSGTYQCLASNAASNTPTRHNISLIVESPPFWKDGKPPEDENTSEEESAQFDCKAEGTPKPNIAWFINGQKLSEIPANKRRIEGVDYIRFVNVTKTDTLVIQCNASNKHGYIYANAFLNVFADPPSFLETPAQTTKVAEGQTAVLACQAFGAPKPQILWLRGENRLENITLKDRFELERTGNLKIKRVRLEDADRYVCNATNKFGSDDANGRLIVRAKTRIVDSPPSEKVVNATDDVILNCSAKTDKEEESKLKIDWLKNGEKIDFMKEPSVSRNMQDNSLRIINAKVTDTAVYTCNASNGLDFHAVDVKFVVRGAPDPPYDVILLNCVSMTAEIGWKIGANNNEPITKFLIYQNTSHSRGKVVPASPAFARATATKWKIKLQPWTNYTFRARAVNVLGESGDSNLTPALCTTPANQPFRHPTGVCTVNEKPEHLVIVWEPMPSEELNGPNFKYVVGYKPRSGGAEETQEVRDPTQGRLVVEGVPPYTEFEIYVRAVNEKGSAHAQMLERRVGYSGQASPLVKPTGLSVNKETMNSTSAEFSWKPVDESKEMIRGVFTGYQIVFWRKSHPSDRRTKDKIIRPFEDCPLIRTRRRRHHKTRQVNLVTARTDNLWPYSDITAGVLVMNGGGQKGELSDTIDFTTPEGVPSKVEPLDVIEKGSNHFKLQWKPPVEINGVLKGYEIKYVPVSPSVGATQTVSVDNPTQLQKKISGLTNGTRYIIYIYAKTGAGLGAEHFIEDTTLELSPPDKPAVLGTFSGDDFVNISWSPSKENPPKNPGSEFQVKYRKTKPPGDGSTSDSTTPEAWIFAKPVDDQNWVNISNLENGETYEFVVVATNGGTDPTESDATKVVIGQNEQPVEQHSIASAGWFIALLCIIAFLLLILLLLCLIKRNRGGKYAVHEKEKLRGHDSTRDDDEAGFGEHTRTDEPDLHKSKLSVNSEEKPLESETDSLGEYEDPDPSKFKEDGSFMGQ